MDERTAFAPATVGNAGVGFDVLGFAVDGIGDRVTVRRGEPGVRVVGISGVAADLPREPEANTATAGLLSLADDLRLDFGFDVRIEKGIPLGSGLGGSAASAVASVVAANALLPEPMPRRALLPYALAGEAAATGAPVLDDVAPCLLGGLVLGHEGDDLLPLPVPDGLLCVVVRPGLRIDTRESRATLPVSVPIAVAVRQMVDLASFVAGCYENDLSRVGASCRDLLAEPHRTHRVPGFAEARAAALDAGALAFALSGSGPTVFALVTADTAPAVERAVGAVFAARGVAAESWISPVGAEGARIVE